MIFNLPLPPSVNQLYFNRKGGRAKTKLYEDWITVARDALRKQKAIPIFGQVSIEYVISEKSRCDLGNHEKALTDLLVTHGILEDDSKDHVRRISLEWSPDVSGVHVRIRDAWEI